MLKYKLGHIMLFLILVGICCGIFAMYHLYTSKKMAIDNNLKILEKLKTSEQIAIKSYYSSIKNYLNIDAKQIGYTYTVTQAKEPATFKINLADEKFKKNYVSNIIILDSSLNLNYSCKNFDLKNLTTIIKDTKFENNHNVTDFYLENKNLNQYHIFKIDSLDLYVIYVFNNNLFKDLVPRDRLYNYDFYNNNYQLIYSTRKDAEYISVINPLTKRILDGRTSTELYNNEYHSYTFIDFDNSSFYINVTTNSANVLENFNQDVLNTIFIFIFVLILTFIFGSIYVKYNKTSSPNTNISDSSLLEYFGDNILEAIIKVDEVILTLEKLKNLKQTLYKSNLTLNSLKESDHDV